MTPSTIFTIYFAVCFDSVCKLRQNVLKKSRNRTELESVITCPSRFAHISPSGQGHMHMDFNVSTPQFLSSEPSATRSSQLQLNFPHYLSEGNRLNMLSGSQNFPAIVHSYAVEYVLLLMLQLRHYLLLIPTHHCFRRNRVCCLRRR